MAFFKKRKEGVDHSANAAPPESVEVLRKRAKHRLIGTAILVLAAIIGFPLLVDKQPRPSEFNIPIVIADKGKVKPPLEAAVPERVPAVVVETPRVAEPPDQAASAVVPPVVTKAPLVPEKKPVPDKKPVVTAAPAASEDRFVVQVGAYAEQARAREARLKLEHAGLKTYTQVVESKEGRRIRVRTGPYASRAQAERDVEKIKKLDLPATVLNL